jgi:hypothetical protein
LIVTLGYSVVEKVGVSHNTDTILADANLAIGYPMQSVVDGHLGIELLGYQLAEISSQW